MLNPPSSSATLPSEDASTAFPAATSEHRTESARTTLRDSELQDSQLRQRHTSSPSNYANDKQKPKSFPSSSSSSFEDIKEDSYFECNICLATAREPVVTLCGHLVRTSYAWNIIIIDSVIFIYTNLCDTKVVLLEVSISMDQFNSAESKYVSCMRFPYLKG